MRIRYAGLALIVIAGAGAVSGKAQIIENQHSSTLRIAPIDRQGPVQNFIDLLNLRNADAAIVPSDVMAYLRDGRLLDAGSSIAYIRKVDQEEVHILAREDIINIADLAGKNVNFDLRDSSSFITASVLFRALKINVHPVSMDQPRALQQLRQGEIAATVHVAKSPARLFFDLNWTDPVHFLPVPFTDEISRIYVPSRLAPADYPLLIPGGEAGRGVPITTVAVPIVLAVNSRALREGNGDVSHLVGAASAAAIVHQEPTSRPDQSVEVPGWRRLVLTERGMGGEIDSARMQSTPQASSGGNGELTGQSPHSRQQSSTRDETDLSVAKHREVVFREFLRWREEVLLSHNPPPQSATDAFNEFMRSQGKH